MGISFLYLFSNQLRFFSAHILPVRNAFHIIDNHRYTRIIGEPVLASSRPSPYNAYRRTRLHLLISSAPNTHFSRKASFFLRAIPMISNPHRFFLLSISLTILLLLPV